MVSKDSDTDAKTIKTEVKIEKLDWDADMEIQLFYAMMNHKPVGASKHFQMLCIAEKLSNSLAREVSITDIWAHLETMYNLKMLDDTEPPLFPNEVTPFSLPESEFGVFMKQKLKEATVVPTEESDEPRSPSPKTSTPRSSSRGTATREAKAIRKDSTTGLLMATKTRKESGSSHASTDTPSNKSEKDYDPRRDSRDSNASGTRDSTSSRKSMSQREQPSRSSKVSAAWDSPTADEDLSSRRVRRRTHTPVPNITPPTTRRRT